jgi:hypothetical protein
MKESRDTRNLIAMFSFPRYFNVISEVNMKTSEYTNNVISTNNEAFVQTLSNLVRISEVKCNLPSPPPNGNLQQSHEVEILASTPRQGSRVKQHSSRQWGTTVAFALVFPSTDLCALSMRHCLRQHCFIPAGSAVSSCVYKLEP